MPATVRRLVARDLDRVVAIERIAFTDPWPRSAFAELLAEAHVRAFAVDGADGRIAGYALASVAADEGEILNLAVEPGVRRRGLGRGLLDALLAMFRAEGVGTVHLEVRESNAPAMRLYEGAGFRPVSTRRAYYRNPTENAVTMALPLSPEVAEKG